MDYKHPHPINIIENTSKYFLLLLLPALRGLLFSKAGFYAWLQGAWFDILILFGILGMGFVSWFFYLYKADNQGIHFKKGILFKKTRFIPYERLSTVTFEYPYYLMPFRAVRFKSDTDAGNSKTPDFSITMRKKDALRLIEKSQIPFRNNDNLKRVYQPKSLYVAILSLITSNTLTGVLFFSALVSQSGNLLGQEFEDKLVDSLTNIAKLLAFGVPTFAAILAYIFLGGWAIAFILNIIRHKGFTVSRKGNVLDIKTGILITRRYSISTKRVNLIEARQSLLTKLFGFFSVFIHSSGYGKQKNELSVLIPAANKYETKRNLHILLPEIPLGTRQIRPKIKTLSRFLVPPISIILGLVGLSIVSYWLFPAFSKVILFLGIMAELPAFWFLFVKIVSYFHTGIGKHNDVYTFSYTYAYSIVTSAIPAKKISTIVLRQSLFQKFSNCCDVVVFSYSEGTKRQVVPNINLDEANQILGVKVKK
ncbi:MAG: putative rane protein [Oscillospiraceae bacterium]|jgi:putative membrane protein|nr:putative rane protein [Oscillospiraceae bacterium]